MRTCTLASPGGSRETPGINFLAHLYLAAPTDASRIGNVLGDFVKGTPDSLRGRFPDEVVHGILMHRSLDRFTDAHPAFRESRALLAPERRRFAGIIVDVIFDHFLALHWETFSDVPLTDFIAEMYHTLARHPDWLDDTLRAILPRMREENWLHSYTTLEGLGLTFRRIARRSPRTTPVAGSLEDLTAHYQSFDHAFHQFFPDVRNESRSLQQQRLLPW